MTTTIEENVIVPESTPLQETQMTVQAFEARLLELDIEDRNFELIDGIMGEKAMPDWDHASISGYLTIILGYFILQQRLGRLVPELRINLPNDQFNSRQPDIVFVAATHGAFDGGAPLPIMPDLVVEVKSPRDTCAKMRLKANYYIDHGARLVWLVFPAKKTIEIYDAADDSIRTLTADDTLTNDALFPGFSVSVAKIFEGESL